MLSIMNKLTAGFAVFSMGVSLQAQVVSQAPAPNEDMKIGYSWATPPTAEVAPVVTNLEKKWAVANSTVPLIPAGSKTTVNPCVKCQRTKCCCSQKKQEAFNKAVAGSHKGVFYANDFSYINDPCYCDWWPGDNLKQLGLGCSTLDIGGQFRARMHREENHRGLGLTGNSDDFLLYRTRVFANWKATDNIRFFVEYIDAVSNYEAFAPRLIEENRSDLLNLFLDVKLYENNCGSLTARGGRQELLYGAQRTISPLDWGNTRRTFDGGKLMWNGKNWDIDGFWVAPTVRDFRNFDDSNSDVQFYGVYSSYKGFESDKLEWYWLALDNDVNGSRFDTIGGRYQGSCDCWLFEAEGAYQFGDNADNSDHDAGAFTVGLGRKLNNCFKQTLWFYYDWASGDDAQGAGNGYHHLFPLAHRYNGFMDLFGRRNLEDLNVLLTSELSPKVKVLLWYHYFWLENQNDSPYNVNMSAFNGGITPGDDELGQEIDVALSIACNARTSLLFGYSHFWTGGYYDTPGLPTNADASFYYTQLQINF